MAIRRALSAGTWGPQAGTGTATWDAVPVDGDTVHANGFAITMSAGCIMPATNLRTTAGTATLGGAIAAGGSFTVTASTDITLASVLSGSTTCLVISAASLTSAISIADCRGSGTTTNIPGLAISSTTSAFTFSNTSFFGGSATGTVYGASFTGSGTIAFTNCTATGGPGAATAYGVAIAGTNAASGTLNLAQVSNSAAHALSYTSLSDSNLTGSVNHQNYGGTISYSATGLLTYTITSETITGTFTGGNGLFSAIGGIGTLTVVRPSGSLQLANATYGFSNTGTVGLTISGDLTCTNAAVALQQNISGSGVLRHNGILTGPAAWATGDQVSTVNGGLVVLDRLARNPSSGFLPSFNGICKFKSTSTIVATTESGTVTLVDATTAGDPPSQANVRSGTTYQFGAMTGTCAVPGASSVAAGVPVDATTGTAVLTQAAVNSALANYETNGVASQNDLASVGGGGGGTDWTNDEKAQIRYQLGIDGTATAPTAPVTSPVVIVPSGAGKTTCYALCVDRRGDPKAGVAVHCWLAKTRPAGLGIIADDLVEVFTSAENGVVQIPDRMLGFSYAFAIGSTVNPIVVRISPTAGETTPIPDLIS